MNLCDFHEVAFAPFFILFALYFLEVRRYKTFWIFLLLSLIIKEEIALSFCFVGLYAIFAKKERIFGLIIFLVSIIYFAVVTKIFMPYFGQIYNFANRYLEFAKSSNDSYFNIFYNVITHPLKVFKFIFFDFSKILYIVKLFYPVLFLPFYSGMAFILLLPSLLINLLSSDGFQYNIYYQYNGVIIPFLFFAAINGYENFFSKGEYIEYKRLFAYFILLVSFADMASLILCQPLIHHNDHGRAEVSAIIARNKIT